jgi:hypothetical protein
MITKQEENRATVIAAVGSAVVMGLLILLLILWMIHVPNPPIIEDEISLSGGGGGGGKNEVEVTFAANDPAYANYKFPEPVNETAVTNVSSADNSVLISDPSGVAINETKSTQTNTTTTQPKNTDNNTPKNPVKWGSQLSNASDNATSTTGGTSTTGDDIGPGTGPDFTTAGNSGTGTGTGGTGGTKGPGGFGTGRKTLVSPCRPNITKREGKVVVIIKVDRNGNVVDVETNGPGTDTSDPELLTQARQAAFCTKFEACTDCPAISKGTIIFDFGYSNK